MTISGSLSNALSGLAAASRAAEVVSSNVANSLTEGYGRRQLDLASRAVGGNGAGVLVQGVHRSVDEHVIAERRLADAAFGEASVASEFFGQLELVFGLPDDAGSLTGRLAQFEATLLEAASRPDSDARLNSVLTTAGAFSNFLNQASGQIQQLRLNADNEIDRQVGLLNNGLSKITELNQQIRSQLAAGNDATALMDHRQQFIDSVSGIVPLRQVPRQGGQIALFTTGGSIVLDSSASVVEFSAVGTIVPQMEIGSSTLSGLTINGLSVPLTENGPMSGGSLSGLFAIRDDHGVVAQKRLDAVARDLIERFADPAVDPSLGPADPGIFTDASLPFNLANEIGLSGRIEINSLLDPATGGAVWRLRDGLNATTPGDVGNSTLLQSLSTALRTPRVPASGGFIGAARSAIGLSSDLMSLTNISLRSLDAESSFALAQVDILKNAELQNGVDTDYEMQQLLLIEQAYAANARVVATIDEMIHTILGL
ncbi:MAG: flagellar hook-associated protein FlgK [Paracoccaceae bacterium]